MLLFAPFAHRGLTWLWLATLAAVFAKELYNLAFTWLAVGLIGEDAAYIVAASYLVGLMVSLFAGIWVDQWDLQRTMVASAVARGAIVLTLPLAVGLGIGAPLWLVSLVALAFAGFVPLFEPALQACVPRLATTPTLLNASNGLIDSTRRFARISAPGLVGVLAAVVPLVHVFTVSAALLGMTAATIIALRPYLPPAGTPAARPDGWRRRVVDALVAGWQTTQGNALVRFVLVSTGFNNAAWTVAFTIGLALLVRLKVADDLGAYALVIAAYGAGNVAASLVVGNIAVERKARVMFTGRLVVGAGFVALAFAPSTPWMMAAAAFAACGGPMNELQATALIQTSFPIQATARIFRLRMAIDYLVTLLGLLVAPALFATLGVSAVMALCGGVIFSIGIIGLWGFAGDLPPRQDLPEVR